MSCQTILPVAVDCPITIYIGATFGPFLISIVDDVNGDPVDITGYGVKAEVRPVAQYPTIYLDLQPVISDSTSGGITIEVPDTVTSTLVPMVCVWDLILVSTTGRRLGPFVGGSATITTPVSRTP